MADRPALKRYFPSTRIEEILETIEEFADFVDVTTVVDICRDPKDNFLLSLCVDGQADFLLTGDKDLLDLTVFENTSIMTISNFLKLK